MSLRVRLREAATPVIGLVLPAALAALAVWQIERALHRLNEGAFAGTWDGAGGASGADLLCQIRIGLSLLALAAAVIAMLAHAAGLIMASSAGRRSLRSRPELVSAFGGVAASLPVLLSFLLGGIAVAIAAAMLSDMLALLGAVHGAGAVRLQILLAALAIGALRLAWTALKRLRAALANATPEVRRVLARAVSPEEAPGLWQMVTRLAAQAGAEPPGSILLGALPQTYVTSVSVRIMPEDRLVEGRILHLSLPLLAALGEAEMAAVISHELAHFTGEDTEYSQRFMPTYGVMQRALAAVNTGGTWTQRQQMRPAVLLAVTMLSRFHEAVMHWSRLRELEADRAMVAATDAVTAASALLRHTLASHVLDQALRAGSALSAGLAAGDLPAEADFVAATASGLAALPPDAPTAHLQDRQPHPTDTHPTIAARIAAMGLVADAPLVARAARPVTDEDEARVAALFADWAGIKKAVFAPVMAVARAQATAHHAALTKLAEGRSAQDFPVQERLRVFLARCIAGGVVLLAPGVVVGLSMAEAIRRQNPAIFAMAVVAALFFAAGGFVLWRVVQVWRQPRPLVILRADGIHVAGLQRIDWADIAKFHAQWQRRAGVPVRLTLTLTAEAAWPAGRRPQRVAFNRRKRRITINPIYPIGLRGKAFFDLVSEYQRGAAARRYLRQNAAAAASADAPPPDIPLAIEAV